MRSETAITGNRPRARDNDVDEVFQLVLEGQGRRLLEVMARGVTPMVERDGLSPLHLAAACDDIDTAAILFESGAVIDVETWPESSGLASLRRFLRRSPQQSQRWPEAGLRESDLWVEVDRRTRRSFLGEHHLGALGCTPLHIASDRGCTAMVQWLLDHGANAHLSVYLDGGPEGFWSWSPLALAVGQPGEHPHSDVVLLLEQWAQDHLHTTADEAVARFRERRVPDSGSA